MSRDHREDALRHHARLWSSFYSNVVDGAPVETHPIIFIARAGSETDAQAIAAALRNRHCEVVELKKRWWRPIRPWTIIAKAEPMPFTKESTRQWVEDTATLLEPFNGILAKWMSFESVAGPGA